MCDVMEPRSCFKFSYRLGEGHAGDRPVKHSRPDDVQRVEAHRVPNADVRSQQLNGTGHRDSVLDIQQRRSNR